MYSTTPVLILLLSRFIHSAYGFSFNSVTTSGITIQSSPACDDDDVEFGRRAFVQSTLASAFLVATTTSPAHASYIDPTTNPPEITKRVFIDVLINGKGEYRIEIGLFGELMPRTVDNFAKLFESNAYAGTDFYRVLSDFSIQGGAIGDPSGKTGQSSLDGGKPFEPDNFNLKHTKEGLVSAVRGLDGRIDSRFFINCKDDAGWADDRYAAFGIVLGNGMDVVKRIEKVPVKPPKNSPLNEVRILKSGAL
ncbi:unnamed protein product [Cylindrotheca closterium]|uniref:Peptidyl-prolyl cis-trans isomerase n=1 Tax=Cylindrotheca closterium TaxID=2856 RepID=A0AAD2JNI3_9STRA|nr:unnamed protein product [Cylindrotheca closterium]